MQKTRAYSLWERMFFSEMILSKSTAQRIAYIGVMASLNIIANMFFEFKLADVQFSLTILFSILSGIFIGPVFGFVSVFVGDAIGFLYNSAGFVYMPWVGLSGATMALISGLIFNIKLSFNGALYIKLAVICVLSLFVCTIGINTTGLYYYWLSVGFSASTQSAIFEKLGTGVTYWTYVFYRLFISLQIVNSIVNYVLVYLVVVALKAIKPLKLFEEQL